MIRNLFIHLLFLLAGVLMVTTVSARNWYIAPDGSDVTGNGSIGNPYATIMKAQQSVASGDTIFLRGGVYKMKESQIASYASIWAYMNFLEKNGSGPNQRICYWAYPGERPIIDMSDVKPVNYRIIVFYVKGSYLHFKGLEIIGTQVTITTHTQSECFRNDGGSNNIYENCVMRDGMAIGFYLTRGSNNLVLNCDAYRNWDSVSEGGKGGNVDGFGAHPNKGSVGNVFRGCRAWFNSDDGYDCISAREAVVFDNCWAFYNGYTSAFVSKADGNGFKIGGFGQAPVVSNLPSPIPSHTTRFCLAFRNKANGFYANHQVEAGSYWYNNTAYRNSTNFNMLSQMITTSIKTGNDTTIDCPGIRHVLHNNLSFRYASQRDTLNIGTSTNTHNSFSPGINVVVDANDFVSIDEAELVLPRKPDGSLPDISFLCLKTGSDLIDIGKDLGFPFNGSLPDLGAFETEVTTSALDLTMMRPFFPNPVVDVMSFSETAETILIYNIHGHLTKKVHQARQVEVADLNSGVYVVKLILKNQETQSYKVVKW